MLHLSDQIRLPIAQLELIVCGLNKLVEDSEVQDDNKLLNQYRVSELTLLLEQVSIELREILDAASE